ncbi:hypothetical protein ANO11243_006080 [Dothideomycetidae sp. 11243]|nr:hypothetical protein ANO11243_006080 [fungal sp. No.11243]
MVGVPQSKGCDACRKQKKSCEGDTIPCVRCKRLQIPCIGRGQQRFKFQDETARFENGVSHTRPTKKHKKPSPVKADADPQPVQDRASSDQVLVPTTQAQSIPILHMPGNQLSRLVASFVDHIDPKLDSRWQPPWNFTRLLQAIPSRLGCNQALDASAEAVLSAYQSCRARHVDASSSASDLVQQQSLKHYNKALKALVGCLNDSVQAGSSETLCSTLLLLMFETLSGPVNERVLGHAGGAAKILKARGFASAKNDFEAKVFLALRGPVIFQALFAEKIVFTDDEWRNLVHNPYEDEGVVGRLLRTLASVPNFLHRIRAALSHDAVDYQELERLRLLLSTARSAHGFDHQDVAAKLTKLEQEFPDPATRSQEVTLLHCNYSRHVGMALLAELELLYLLSAVHYPTSPPPRLDKVPIRDGLDEYMLLAADRAVEVSDLAERIACHRPLGSFYMDFCLKSAYIAAGDRACQLKILGQAWEFAFDMFGSSATVNLEELGKHATTPDGSPVRIQELGDVDAANVGYWMTGYNPAG